MRFALQVWWIIRHMAALMGLFENIERGRVGECVNEAILAGSSF